MSFEEKVEAALGVDAAEIEVTVNQDTLRWGERATGVVRVRGGQVEQSLAKVTVSLREHWTAYTGERGKEERYRYHGELELAGPGAVAPGSAAEYPFELPVPDLAGLGCDWAAFARAHVIGGLDPEASAGLRLLPPPAVSGLRAALLAVAPFRDLSVGSSGGTVTMDFDSPRGGGDLLDAVKLVVAEESGEVHGVLEINPQEHTLTDALKSLVLLDRVKREIRFPAAPLAAAAQGSPPEEVVSALRQLLQPYLT